MNRSNKKFKSLLTTPQEKTYMVSLLNSSEFKAVLMRYGKVFSRILFSGRKVQSRLQILTKLGDMLLRITRHHGPVFTVKYLKALNVSLQRFIGGQPLKSLREIEPNLPFPGLTTSGLPKFIPSRERDELKKLTPSVVRWWLTFFSIYRIISIPGQLKLNTITDPFGGNKAVMNEVSRWLIEYSKQFLSLFRSDFIPRTSLGLERILKASPSSQHSFSGFLSDAGAWKGRSEFFQFANFGQFSLYFDMFNVQKEMEPRVPLRDVKFGRDPESDVPLGQLALKEEAAGKIRVFAMVDVWTQSVLKPLHDWLFSTFRMLPNDCTHNQDIGFLRAQKKAIEYGSAWCYDLSAATDRLPILLQSSILDSLFGSIEPDEDFGITYGRAWADLLTKREYYLPAQDRGDLKVESQSLRYAVGQPMGAYSSWAMLNLCHHLILQYICFNLYKEVRWYECYEVLGDDIVIFDAKVAKQYYVLMNDQLDVKCNQSKSLIAPSRPVIEFAKRVSIGKAEVSAFSWRMARSFDSLFGRAAMAADIVSRRHVSHPLRAFKAITGPQWGPIPSYAYSLISYAGIMVNRGLVSFESFMKFLVDPKNPLRFIGGRIIANVRIGALETLMLRSLGTSPLPRFKLKEEALGRLFQLNQAAARGYLEDQSVELTFKCQSYIHRHLVMLADYFGPDSTGALLPLDLLQMTFFPGLKFLKPVKLVDLNNLSFGELVERVDHLRQIEREFLFFKQTVSRRLVLEDSFKLLKFISSSRKRGSLSFERTLLT